MTELSNIKIPSKVYVGFQGRRSQDEVPLGFMTPWGDDQAGTKRMATVDSWAHGYGHNKTFNSVTLENSPMIGFKIGRAIKRSRSWGGNASYIRIEDPRGFELEISIENLVMAMNGNIVEDGELLAECVWGREGSRNILLPTNSEPYMASLETKAKIDAAISLRDVKAGDTIKLLTGEEGLYLGSMFPVSVNHNNYRRSGDSSTREAEIGKNKRYVMVIDGVITGFTQIKVSGITKAADAKLSPDEAQKIVSDLINGGAKLVNSSADYYSTLRGYVVNAKNLTISSKLAPVKEADLIARFTNSDLDYQDRYISVLAEDTKGAVLHLYSNDNFGSPHQGGRHRPEREYQVMGAIYYHHRRSVKTNGFVGDPATYSQTNNQIEIANDCTNHIEAADLVSLSYVEITVESSGTQFKFLL